jgi:hypothetical protein
MRQTYTISVRQLQDWLDLLAAYPKIKDSSIGGYSIAIIRLASRTLLPNTSLVVTVATGTDANDDTTKNASSH